MIDTDTVYIQFLFTVHSGLRKCGLNYDSNFEEEREFVVYNIHTIVGTGKFAKPLDFIPLVEIKWMLLSTVFCERFSCRPLWAWTPYAVKNDAELLIPLPPPTKHGN